MPQQRRQIIGRGGSLAARDQKCASHEVCVDDDMLVVAAIAPERGQPVADRDKSVWTAHVSSGLVGMQLRRPARVPRETVEDGTIHASTPATCHNCLDCILQVLLLRERPLDEGARHQQISGAVLQVQA